MLAGWLARLERLHPSAVDLGLERVGRVAGAMGLERPAPRVVTVAGTNGKGSACAFLEAILAAHGLRAGVYTSPHLVDFRERIRIAGREADAGDIVAALERVEAARGETSLTYFEFTTLAALDLFRRAALDVAVLEVGLGGRLDATNVVDADVAVVTSVGLDHAEWLGHDRDSVAREKAGIARRGRPLVVGEAEPTAGLLAAAGEIGARALRAGTDFGWQPDSKGWSAWTGAWRGRALPPPALAGGYQRANAATALAAIDALGLALDTGAVERGLRAARIPGRFEVRPGTVEIVLDVAHNPDAAATLVRALAERPPPGRTHAVVAMYRDKDVAGVLAALRPAVDAWFLADLPAPRGATAAALATALGAATPAPVQAADPAAAFAAARAAARPGDRIVVAGSFGTVAAVAARLDAA